MAPARAYSTTQRSASATAQDGPFRPAPDKVLPGTRDKGLLGLARRLVGWLSGGLLGLETRGFARDCPLQEVLSCSSGV